ncbi:SdrD B-like domain-containing protein [Actinokineospora bangkokensis]|uniref:SD-repeat containing protein B domain-containing protein n=1 Tax=Actinokineospora bangkokensis TaxID=1193682 RepID=A0A1Q9LNV8_9PSEU|nr:SdrD B-like domain-containing protein [Actinokineospora bangkokensis]OLR93722.1 hypothetical protein BJP25_15815 [Actinokineospora bangkokensis]
MNKSTRTTAAAALLALFTLPALAGTASAAAAEGAICGTVWRDSDGDGLREAGEPLIANHTVGLVGLGGSYVNTAADGTYCLNGLEAGTYTVQSNDRALFVPSEGLTVAGKDSKFERSESTAAVTVGEGQTVSGIDAGYVVSDEDVRAVQLILDFGDRTYALDQQWLDEPVQVGQEFDIYGSVTIEGNTSDQMWAELHLPAGLSAQETLGGMPSVFDGLPEEGQRVHGQFAGRKEPGLVEFIGVRVRVVAPFDASDITVKALAGVHPDEDPGNNTLVGSISAVAAPVTPTPSGGATTPPPAPAGGVRPAGNVVPAASGPQLANTGVDPVLGIGIGSGLVLAGAGALWFARTRRSQA